LEVSCPRPRRALTPLLPSSVHSVDLPADPADPLDATFTYSVAWSASDVPFAKRMDRYRADAAAPRHLEVHWFAVANSGVTVLLLTGFLATILVRVLKSDVARYAAGADAGDGYGAYASAAGDDDDECGWKYVHGDVFRFPPGAWRGRVGEWRDGVTLRASTPVLPQPKTCFAP